MKPLDHAEQPGHPKRPKQRYGLALFLVAVVQPIGQVDPRGQHYYEVEEAPPVAKVPFLLHCYLDHGFDSEYDSEGKIDPAYNLRHIFRLIIPTNRHNKSIRDNRDRNSMLKYRTNRHII